MPIGFLVLVAIILTFAVLDFSKSEKNVNEKMDLQDLKKKDQINKSKIFNKLGMIILFLGFLYYFMKFREKFGNIFAFVLFFS